MCSHLVRDQPLRRYQRELKKIAEQQKEAVTPAMLNETLRESETIRCVETKVYYSTKYWKKNGVK